MAIKGLKPDDKILLTVQNFEQDYISRISFDEMKARAEVAEKELAALRIEYDLCYERMEAAETRIAELDAAARWIPVSEKLPKEGQEVIVMGYGGFVSNWWHGIKWARMLTENYAYWMPLPQPPKPEGER